MSYGFVYILGNESIAGLYKVGFTLRSPSARCAELSKATGVAKPFQIICYAEFSDVEAAERSIHDELSDLRDTERREFFRGNLRRIVDAVMQAEDALTVCEHDADAAVACAHRGPRSTTMSINRSFE